MICPFCKSEKTKVVDKRETGSGAVTRRRRECIECGKRFTTYERAEEFDVFVIKKDGRREPYDRLKLRTGISKACEKRPVSQEIINEIVDRIENDLRQLKTIEVKSNIIGEKVMGELKKLDKVAYIRFASVYREFADATDFQNELKGLINEVNREANGDGN
jgi:transcriptional repressor NrdR